jgi:anaerobic selenocysteine-containing dehydrogenase
MKTMEKEVKPTISRRAFLQTSAAAGAAVAVSNQVWGKRAFLPAAGGKAIKTAQAGEWHHGYCRMCFKPHCPILVRVKDGVVVEVQGDPDAPTNIGTLCGRGHSAIFSLYNPYRVKTPLKRTNPNKELDQDPGWVEITWDEALNTIVDHLKKVKADDPRKIATNTGFGIGADFYRAEVVENFLRAYGAPAENNIQTNGPLCSDHLISSMTANSMTNAPDFSFCNYLIALGGTFIDWAPSDGSMRGFFDAIERGMKLVVIDPRANNEAARGEWVPIRPGSDLALLLGMLHVMLYEIGLEKLDIPFLKRRSNAPYLIGAGERYLRHPESNKPLIWDPVDEAAKEFDDPTIQDYALEGRYEVYGQTVTPGFALVKQEMKSYTPEWSEGWTTIPAATVRRITNEFVGAAQIGSTIVLDGVEFPHRPVALFMRRGGESLTHGSQVQMAKFLINELVGACDVPGGYQGSRWGATLTPNEDGVVTPVGAAVGRPFRYPVEDVAFGTFYPLRHTMNYLTWRALLDPDKYLLSYEIDTLIIGGANPIMSNGYPDEAVAALKKIPFTISLAYHLDEPTQFADIVLPEPSNLERERIFDVTGNNDKGRWAVELPGGTLYRYPVVSLYESKQIEDLCLELARRLDILGGENGMNARVTRSLRLKEEYALQPDKAYTLADILDRKLKSQYGADKGSDYFKKVGYEFKMYSPKDTYPYASHPMEETRYHFFFEHVRATGDTLRENCEKHNVSVPGWWDMDVLMDFYRAIPHWKTMPIFLEPAEYDMFCTNWRTSLRVLGNGGMEENPMVYEVLKTTDPYSLAILMNSATARRKGIKDGDEIVVESQKGRITGRVKLTERMHPEVVGVGGNYGRRSMQLNPIARDGQNYNQLLNTDDGTFDPLSTAINISARVKVYKA